MGGGGSRSGEATEKNDSQNGGITKALHSLTHLNLLYELKALYESKSSSICG